MRNFSPGRLILWLLSGAVLTVPAWGQDTKPAGSTSAASSTPASTTAPAPARPSLFGSTNAPQAAGVITDTGFASRLANTVGTQGFPTVNLPPGVSGINHPGMAPTPSMQPLPTGSPFPVPNINSPGTPPDANLPSNRGFDRGRGRFGRSSTGVVYYGVPYYVPYYVYPVDPGNVSSPPMSTTATSSPAATPAPAAAPYAPAASSAQPAGNPLTLLAFKDGTVVIATDYWLEGEWLYYVVTTGQRLSGLLERLDQPMTQQLNRERNVPFILEARR
jgi:hypothetical protein